AGPGRLSQGRVHVPLRHRRHPGVERGPGRGSARKAAHDDRPAPRGQRMSTAAPPIPAAEPAPNAIGRVVGALVSPGETFASIARRPTWLAPLLLWIVASIAVTMVLMPRMDWEKLTRDRMERGGQTVSAEQVQRAAEQGKKFGVPFTYGIAVVSPPVAALFT